VENDLRVMIKRWRKKAQNREEWASVMKEAKVLKGPQSKQVAYFCIDLKIFTIVAVTKLHTSRPLKDFTPLPRGSKSPVQRCELCYAASSELSSLTWAPLFVLQYCTILL
jgi:hypothetical protein